MRYTLLFPGDINIVPISGLKDLTDKDKCCIVGTLFKDMELKPSILKEISQQVTNQSFNREKFSTV